MTLAQARAAIDNGELSPANSFDTLAAIGHHGAFVDRDQARETLIRLLERRSTLPPELEPVLQGLVREHGLYPYMWDMDELSLADQLAYEIHRPYSISGDDTVFHAEQAAIYERLLAGENIILSAPTSFGKTLVIDAVLAARQFRNAAIIVPTIALMDECRRRLTRLENIYKIITHASQRRAERNLFVMTQERFLEIGDLPPLDFFALDEFYKLDPQHGDERSTQLNIVFQRLLSTGAQFYLLGPNITELTHGATERLRASFIATGFTTVATDVERISVSTEETPAALVTACHEAGNGTIIFCKSPERTRKVAQWLLDGGVAGGHDLDSAADWIAHAYHPDWLVGRALRSGIGIHHGRLPRALGHHIVRLFNEGRLPYLLATSTLIEGVNTTARTVIVLDNKIANKKYDYFTFANIRGRSGRMLKHFVGKVIVFNPEPKSATLTIDIPILTQPKEIADELLLQLPEDQLTEHSRERIRRYLDQNILSVDVIRKNTGIQASRQLDVAQEVASNPVHFRRALSWSGSHPTIKQMNDVAPLLFALTGSAGPVKSANQLAARVNILRHHRGNLREMVAEQVKRGKSPDEVVEDALDFLRNWAQFKIPRALTAASAIVADVLDETLADPSVFAGELENMFLPPYAAVLEEYGLPIPVTVKLTRELRLDGISTLDDILTSLRELVIPSQLYEFEREMLLETQRTL